MYRDLGYIRHKDYVLHLLDIRRGEKILDIGCKDGAMLVYCGLLGAVVTGIDLKSESIKTAESYIKKYSINGQAVAGDVRKLQFSDNYFDKVISSDFFEHLSPEDNALVLKEAYRVLRPGGALIIKTPRVEIYKPMITSLFERNLSI